MKIFNKNNKERLLEMMEKVNKIKLNEDFMNAPQEQQGSSDMAMLEHSFNELQSGMLRIKRSNTQTSGAETYLELICFSKQGSDTIFRFKIETSEGDQDGVMTLNDAELVSLTNDNINIQENSRDLQQFNAQHKNEMIDIVSEYADFGSSSEEPEIDEVYENAVKQIDSYLKEEESEYPNPIGTKFKVKSKYPKPKKKPQTNVNIDESEDDIDQLMNDKEESGDMLSGGIGDEKSPLDFDKEQLIKGVKVEMEHTDDPMVALEIAIDHLTEMPDYYDKLDNMEKGACDDKPHSSGAYTQDGMAGETDRNGHPIPAIDPDFSKMTNPDKDMGSPAEFDRLTKSDKSEKEMEDVLLGYKPKNVGDDVE